MDATVALIADYAHALRFSDLPPATVHQCKRCVVDWFGVALGAFDAEPSRIARAMAQRASVVTGAHVIGTAHRTLPELAAYANGVMGRYLDGNDAFPGGGGHPSDTVAAVLAVADVNGKTGGTTLITAITLAYEISYLLWKVTGVRGKGIDNVFYAVAGGAVGAAKAMGLDRAKIAETIALAITPNIPLDATRYGNLSMWKGCAGGNAVRNSVFAALLAAAGMTGPEKSIDGGHGLQKLLGEFRLPPFAGAGRPFKINETTFKFFLAEAHSLAPIAVALQLSRQIAVADIEKVTIYTYRFAWDVTAGEPEKWRPTTREAADHSMPYIIAAVLTDRAFSDEIFSDKRLRDSQIHRLCDKIEVKEDAELTRRFPQCMPCRIEIRTSSGELKVGAADYPRGHYMNPMTDEELNVKFRGLARRVLPDSNVERALEALWQLDSVTDIGDVFETMQVGG